MECAEIRSGFVAGRVPAGPEVDAHLKSCPHCRELFEKDAALGRRLAQAVLPELAPGDLFALVERDVRPRSGCARGCERCRRESVRRRWWASPARSRSTSCCYTDGQTTRRRSSGGSAWRLAWLWSFAACS